MDNFKLLPITYVCGFEGSLREIYLKISLMKTQFIYRSKCTGTDARNEYSGEEKNKRGRTKNDREKLELGTANRNGEVLALRIAAIIHS